VKAINILLVEDNEGDILLATEAAEESGIVDNIRIIKDGKAAIRFFETLTKKEKLPELVLLDINLPKVNGQQVLTYIKNSERFKNIPVVMLTTSSSEEDIAQSCKNNASCYITKPIGATDFKKAIQASGYFWTNIVSMPFWKNCHPW
jgi:CheY-like chemotaxis protein